MLNMRIWIWWLKEDGFNTSHWIEWFFVKFSSNSTRFQIKYIIQILIFSYTTYDSKDSVEINPLTDSGVLSLAKNWWRNWWQTYRMHMNIRCQHFDWLKYFVFSVYLLVWAQRRHASNSLSIKTFNWFLTLHLNNRNLRNKFSFVINGETYMDYPILLIR